MDEFEIYQHLVKQYKMKKDTPFFNVHKYRLEKPGLDFRLLFNSSERKKYGMAFDIYYGATHDNGNGNLVEIHLNALMHDINIAIDFLTNLINIFIKYNKLEEKSLVKLEELANDVEINMYPYAEKAEDAEMIEFSTEWLEIEKSYCIIYDPTNLSSYRATIFHLRRMLRLVDNLRKSYQVLQT